MSGSGSGKGYEYRPAVTSGLGAMSLYGAQNIEMGRFRAELLAELQRVLNEWTSRAATAKLGNVSAESFLQELAPAVFLAFIRYFHLCAQKGLVAARAAARGIRKGASLTVGTTTVPSKVPIIGAFLPAQTVEYVITGLSDSELTQIDRIVSRYPAAAAMFGLSPRSARPDAVVAGPTIDKDMIASVITGQKNAARFQVKEEGPGRYGAFTMANMSAAAAARGSGAGAGSAGAGSSSSSSSAAAASRAPAPAALAAMQEEKEEEEENGGGGGGAGGSGGYGGGGRRRRGARKGRKATRKGRKGTRKGTRRH